MTKWSFNNYITFARKIYTFVLLIFLLPCLQKKLNMH
jgi:hypothetical protein